MKQSRIGLGVVTMLSIFVVVCMCVLVLFSADKVYQIHEQTNRTYAYLKVKVKDGKIITFKTIVKGES